VDEDKCAQCGTPAPPGAKYCESCGAPLLLAAASQPAEVKHADEDKCAQCGTPAPPGAKYCESCGAPLLLAAASQPAEVKHADEDKCAQCGTPAAPGAKFCESCGAPLAAVTQPVQGPAAAEPAAVYTAPRAQAPYSAPGVEMPYQGVAIRFVALLIDAIILGIITSAISLVAVSYAAIVLGIVIDLLYFTLLLGRYGQSVGMMVVKIKVVSEADSSPITYGAAFVRTILLLIDAIPYVVPYLLGAILIWTSDKKQRLGDRVAHTVVLKA
jgi:uncharacterized RDD family membrane protein YckC/predicted amidophosphoribosyltransferase